MTLKARVKAGRLVVDEPTDLPEGTEVELLALDPGDWLTEEDRAALHRALERLGRRRQGRSTDRCRRRPSRTSVTLKNRHVRFTATAQEHVRREKAWWLANRDHPDVFTEELVDRSVSPPVANLETFLSAGNDETADLKRRSLGRKRSDRPT